MKFEKVPYEFFRKDMLRYGWVEEIINTAYESIKLPERKTKFSSGYDIATPISFMIKPNESVTIPTGLKAVFDSDEAMRYHLQLFIRSSVGIRQGVVMSNQTGVIDADYAGNIDNDGDMLIALRNISDEVVKFNAGDRIIQAIFMIHGLTIDDNAHGERMGGVGSTNNQDSCCNDDYCEIRW